MKTIRLEISDRAWSKLRDAAFVRMLNGGGEGTALDRFALLVCDAIEKGQPMRSIRTTEDELDVRKTPQSSD